MEQIKCSKCGSMEFTTLPNGNWQCKYCGAIIPRSASSSFSETANNVINNANNALSSGSRNKIVAILLSFFLGGLGAQYFYYKEYLKGIICIVFCWTYIPGIWGLIHAVILLTMSDEQFNEKYNNRP